MKFVRNEKGARKLIRNGYMYVHQKDLADEVTSWECELRRRGQCMTRVKLDRHDTFLQEVNDHTPTFPPPPNPPAYADKSLNIRQQCLRNELLNPPNRAEIPVLPQMYQLTSTGGQFLPYDSGIGDDGRILIFASDQGLELLSNSDHWFYDGTFKSMPRNLLPGIHNPRTSRVLPCLFALLPNKNQHAYQIFFREISNLVPGIPQDILFDFERATMNTMQLLLPNVEIKGGFYHLL